MSALLDRPDEAGQSIDVAGAADVLAGVAAQNWHAGDRRRAGQLLAALARATTGSGALERLVRRLSMLGRTGEAVDLVGVFMAHTNNGLARRRAAALSALLSGNPQEAARIYQELRESAPNEPGILEGLRLALLAGGSASEALLVSEQELMTSETRPLALLESGRIEVRLGNHARAEQRFREAAQMSPRWWAPHVELGALACEGGDSVTAASHFEHAESLAPGEFYTRLASIQCHAASGRHAAAVALAESAVADYRGDPRMANTLLRLRAWYVDGCNHARLDWLEGEVRGSWPTIAIPPADLSGCAPGQER